MHIGISIIIGLFISVICIYILLLLAKYVFYKNRCRTRQRRRLVNMIDRYRQIPSHSLDPNNLTHSHRITLRTLLSCNHHEIRELSKIGKVIDLNNEFEIPPHLDTRKEIVEILTERDAYFGSMLSEQLHLICPYCSRLMSSGSALVANYRIIPYGNETCDICHQNLYQPSVYEEREDNILIAPEPEPSNICLQYMGEIVDWCGNFQDDFADCMEFCDMSDIDNKPMKKSYDEDQDDDV